MKVTAKEDIARLLVDEPYYTSPKSYCLGKTLSEAGCVVELIIEDKERQKND